MADYGGYTRDAKELAIMQSYPLDMKIALTRNRIYEWVTQFGEDGVVVSFSGGKDSTVLLHLVRTYFPDVKAVFSNTGLEYPEIQRFVKSFDNVDIVRPKMRFDEVISTYGYPLISKEVAKAIYYARRIRSQDVNVERESEAASAESFTAQERQGAAGQKDSQLTQIPHGEMKQTNWKRMEIGGENERSLPQGLYKRRLIQGYGVMPRRAGVVKPTGKESKSQGNTETAEVPG